MIYLLVVILVWLLRPEYLITAYAIVVGAHFLPYSWLYDSAEYRVVAIVIPVVTFALALMKLTVAIPVVMIVADIAMIVLFLAKTKSKKN